jgi:hypothetical protein
MTTLLNFVLSGFLSAAATPPTQAQSACGTERADYANAKAAVQTERSAGRTADQVRATHAALEAARTAFMCCLHPDYKSCKR